MRGHRQTRDERVACTLKVAAGSVLTPVAAPVPCTLLPPSQPPSPVPRNIDFGASEVHHGHYLYDLMSFLTFIEPQGAQH